MMVVATYTTRNGAVIEVDDSYMAERGSEHENRIIEEQRRVAHKILTAYTERQDRAVSA